MKTKKVWGLFYRIRVSPNSKWSKMTGPCGIFTLPNKLDREIADALQGRPFFFRTRKLARAMATKLDKEKNITWTWVEYTVRPIKLTYEVLS
jgi:hypothetical protein